MFTNATFSRAYENIAFRSTMSSSFETVIFFIESKLLSSTLNGIFECDVCLLDTLDVVGSRSSEENVDESFGWKEEAWISSKMSPGFLLSKILNPENIFLHPSLTSSFPDVWSTFLFLDCLMIESFCICNKTNYFWYSNFQNSKL